MSLKAFHVAFIFLSNLLSLGLGVWCLREAADTGNGTYSLIGVLSLVSFIGLIFYGVWFLKKWKHLSYFVWAAALGLSLVGENAYACPSCIGNPNSPMVIGANAGISFLLTVITVVLFAFAGIFFVWCRREKTWFNASRS